MDAGPSGGSVMAAAADAQPTGTVDFAADSRVHFDQRSGKWSFENDDGREYEWDTARNAWTPVIDDEMYRAQQAAYSVAGVDESTPAAPVLARDKKRRKEGSADPEAVNDGKRKKGKGAARPPPASRNTAVYVTRLPLDAEPEEINTVFSKAGLILPDADGQPKIKIYKDAQGRSKGEGLVVYLKEESVELALKLLDDTELRIGRGGETMRVQKAEFSHKKEDASHSDGKKDPAARRAEEQKRRRAKKAEALKTKLEDWDSDEEAEKKAVAAARFARVVVLQHMFSKEELDEDPALLLDLKEDVREECETLGEVTNVVLYDLEPEGIMTVKYKDPIAAQACILKMNNRFFGGRQVKAFLFDGSKRFKKSGHGVPGINEDEVATEEEEKKRLEAFAKFLEEEA